MTRDPAPDLTRRPRTRRPLTDADMRRLAQLYYDPDIPMPRVAATFGIATSSLMQWIAEMDWPRRRDTPRGQECELPPARPMSWRAEASERPRGRPPSMMTTLRRSNHLLRREIDAAIGMRPRTMDDRERLARLMSSLTRSMERVQKALQTELENAHYRAAKKRQQRDAER